MTLKQGIYRFLKDEEGQTTTEYILILAVVVTIIMQFRKQFKTIVDRLLGSVDQASQEAAQMSYE